MGQTWLDRTQRDKYRHSNSTSCPLCLRHFWCCGLSRSPRTTSCSSIDSSSITYSTVYMWTNVYILWYSASSNYRYIQVIYTPWYVDLIFSTNSLIMSKLTSDNNIYKTKLIERIYFMQGSHSHDTHTFYTKH